ncbi:MAG: SdrD B-like domain-containing protein, partial [Nanoarchaeota archaeon]
MKKSLLLCFVLILLIINIAYGLVPDADQDGVPDANDRCPNSDTMNVDQFGCSCEQNENCKYTVSGYVFLDNNGNGVFDGDDSKIPGEIVYLRNPDDTADIKPPVTTDSSGNYAFTDLAPGDYRVRHNVPDGYVRTNDDSTKFRLDQDYVKNFGIRKGTVQCGDGFCDGAETCSSCESDCGVCYFPYSVSGYVFLDNNGNGVFDGDDSKIPGEIVYLRNPDDTADIKPPVTTDSSGNYAFTDLAPGDYRVRHNVPDGYVRTNDDSTKFRLDQDYVKNFGIRKGTVQCGDGFCDGAETCSSCESDCGVCYFPVCGNGVLDADEECDGNDFGDKSCTDFNFKSGALKCTISEEPTKSCKIDTSGCILDVCILEGGESQIQEPKPATEPLTSFTLFVNPTYSQEPTKLSLYFDKKL